jgi:hypothetical protein
MNKTMTPKEKEINNKRLASLSGINPYSLGNKEEGIRKETMTPKENEIIEEIRKELESGINRNRVLPLDWAMDRISPIIEKAIQQTKSKLREDIEKLRNEPIKFVDKICKDLTLDKVLKSLEDENGK